MVAKVGCVAAALACLALGAGGATAEPVRTWGTCSAAVSRDPRFQNQWEYTLDIGWDTTGWEPERVEQLVVFLNLASCPCLEDPSYFSFPYTSGVTSGKDGTSIYYYYTGYFVRGGSLRFAETSPALIFPYVDTSSELLLQGRVRLVFLSTARPGDFVAYAENVGIVAGPHEARGEITGVFPSCDCPIAPVEASTWGTIKAIFR